MKKLSESDIKEKVINYLKNKGVELELNSESALCWNYNRHYSKFIIKIFLENDDCDNLFFKYYSNAHIYGLYKRKTSITDGFCLKIYKNLMLVKTSLDELAQKTKNITDIETKYCSELKQHYNKKHKKISIDANKYSNNKVSINIHAYDDNSTSYYSISCVENKYYLHSVLINTNEIFQL